MFSLSSILKNQWSNWYESLQTQSFSEFLQYTQQFLERLFLCQGFIACRWTKFCYQSAFFLGFHFINSVHYPLSLYSINYNPQITWKYLTMKSPYSMCMCDSYYAKQTAAGFNVGVIRSYPLPTAVFFNHYIMIWSLWRVPHGPTGALTAIICCFSDKTKLGLDNGGLTWNFRVLVSGMK